MDTLTIGVEIYNEEWEINGSELTGTYSADVVMGSIIINGYVVNDVQTKVDTSGYHTVVSSKVAKIDLTPYSKQSDVDTAIAGINTALGGKQDVIDSTHKLDYSLIDNQPTIPDDLADLASDSTHRVVTDVEKAAWNAKADGALSITWAELKDLRDGGHLQPGRYYRITDYVATTTQAGSRSAGHPFDIIVTALTSNTLSEEASAALHAGESYFAPCKMGAWKIWYCLDNASGRFTWADTVHGKGVIYRMIDEYNNDVPYDFKGIQFKRYTITSVSATRLSALVGLPIGTESNMGITVDITSYKWYYTFSKMGTAWTDAAKDATVVDPTDTYDAYATDNVFTTCNKTDSAQYFPALPNNVFAYGPVVHDFLHTQDGTTHTYVPLTFFVGMRFDGADCSSNTLIGWGGLVTTQSTFRRNLIVGAFRHIDIATNFQDNTIYNTHDFSYITFGHDCYNNIIAVKSMGSLKMSGDFRGNVLQVTTFTYTDIGEYFYNNSITGDVLSLSLFGNAVANCTFTDSYLGSVIINGQLMNCTFDGKFMACTFNPICGYCDFVGGTNGNAVVGLDVVGGIRGTAQARVNVENPTDFVYPDASGTKRRIRLEGDTNGNMVISWFSNGRQVIKTKGASGSTWTDISPS